MAFIDTLKRLGVIAVIRSATEDEAVATAEALIRGGVLGVEVTFSTPGCCNAIRRVLARAPKDAAIGVGTVRSVAQLEEAVAAGATYAISPHVDLAIIAAAKRLGVAMLPGALTPTEAVTAWSAGATCIKLFPASLAGVDYLKALRAPLPDIPFMPTGGVSPENMHEWFAAGAIAVGMGGNLAKGTPASIEAAARDVSQRLARIRASAH
jgi:2-dehydro-3-deoxyphosphogluconate aldolase/(4S)-4-hydroxy-2-oxoglutarate aldolase